MSAFRFQLDGPVVARSTAAFFGLLGAGMGVRSILAPLPFAKDFGLPQNSAESPNAFISAVGARNIASGLALLTFTYLGNTQAMGISMLYGLIAGVGDGLIVLNHGQKDAALGHFLMSIIFSSAGAYLYLLD